jgi:hypothetical protein
MQVGPRYPIKVDIGKPPRQLAVGTIFPVAYERAADLNTTIAHMAAIAYRVSLLADVNQAVNTLVRPLPSIGRVCW